MKSCPDPVELARAEGLPRDHPLREHLRDCGRCRASLRALEAFRNAEVGTEVSGAELTMADKCLEDFISTELLGEEPAAPATDLPRIRPAPTWSRGWLATAAVLVLAVGIWLVSPRFGARDAEVGDELRGELVPADGGLAALVVTPDPGGGVQVSWKPVAGAQTYEIILWTASLAEYKRLEPRPETNHLVSWDPAADPAPVFLSVVAHQGGREIARSDPVSLP